jgi:hypothetical protein
LYLTHIPGQKSALDPIPGPDQYCPKVDTGPALVCSLRITSICKMEKKKERKKAKKIRQKNLLLHVVDI